MQFLDFEAYITVDGVRLPEYEVSTLDSGGAKSASCWIPSEAGKSFVINWRPLRPHPFEVAGHNFLDGLAIGGKIHPENTDNLASQDNLITSPTTVRPLSFSSIQLTDDDAYLNAENVKELGHIVLHISQVERIGEPKQPQTWDGRVDDKVHERSKKALVHRVKLGEETVRQEKLLVQGVKLICTLITFTFKYRSIDVLRADGIAPPGSMAQSNISGKRKADQTRGPSDEDEEDEAELQAQLQLIQTKLAKKKSGKSAKKIKTEPVVRPRSILGDIIDLT